MQRKIDKSKTIIPTRSNAENGSLQTIMLKAVDTIREKFPIRVVTETGPLPIARVLKSTKRVWAIPYNTPQKTISEFKLSVKALSAKRIINHNVDTIRLKKKT